MQSDLRNGFESRINRSGINGCWTWTGALSSGGYGRLWVPEARRSLAAHRISYEIYVGPIPEGFHVDHLCHGWDTTCFRKECVHRRCVNPEHLEAVTPSINRRRSNATKARRMQYAERTHCSSGHKLTEDNRFGIGRCRECDNINRSKARQRRLGTITEICGYISPKGNTCQRQKGHEGRHHSEIPKYKAPLNLRYA